MTELNSKQIGIQASNRLDSLLKDDKFKTYLEQLLGYSLEYLQTDAILKPSNESDSKDEGDINPDGENRSEELKMASTGKKKYVAIGEGITVLPPPLYERMSLWRAEHGYPGVLEY